MARPALSAHNKKENLTLTVSRETKEMAKVIRKKQNRSISKLLEDVIQKEYKKLQRAGGVSDIPILSEMDSEDIKG